VLNKYRQTRTAHIVTRITDLSISLRSGVFTDALEDFEDWSTDSDIQPYNREAEASNVPVGPVATGKEVDFSWMLLGIRQIHGHKKLVTGIGTTLFWIQKTKKTGKGYHP
jgi:hypothetical protein